MRFGVNPNMIVLAREYNGYSQAELAEKIGMSPTNLSKIERSDISINQAVLFLISDATKFPVSFFSQEGSIVPENMNYRKREKVAQKLLTPINARANIVRLHVQQITRALDTKVTVIPAIEVTESLTPAIIARQLRKLWKLKNPITDNVTEVLENNGIVVSGFNFGTERVDSRCVLTDDKVPVIFYNNSMLGDRQRFSLIYQLGHLIMHTFHQVDWERDVSHEANLFAAEFLMPEAEIRDDFANGVTVPLLGELKRKWRVSMIALLYRADDLGFISENQKRYLLQKFNELKIRRREPLELDVPIERPSLIRLWIAELKTQRKFDTKDMASWLHLSTDEFIQLYG